MQFDLCALSCSRARVGTKQNSGMFYERLRKVYCLLVEPLLCAKVILNPFPVHAIETPKAHAASSLDVCNGDDSVSGTVVCTRSIASIFTSHDATYQV